MADKERQESELERERTAGLAAERDLALDRCYWELLGLRKEILGLRKDILGLAAKRDLALDRCCLSTTP
jgi:hypothetical protein